MAEAIFPELNESGLVLGDEDLARFTTSGPAALRGEPISTLLPASLQPQPRALNEIEQLTPEQVAEVNRVGGMRPEPPPPVELPQQAAPPVSLPDISGTRSVFESGDIGKIFGGRRLAGQIIDAEGKAVQLFEPVGGGEGEIQEEGVTRALPGGVISPQQPPAPPPLPFDLSPEDRVVREQAIQAVNQDIFQLESQASRLDLQVAGAKRVRDTNRRRADALFDQAKQFKKESNSIRFRMSSLTNPRQAQFNMRRITELDRAADSLMSQAQQFQALTAPRGRERGILRQQAFGLRDESRRLKAGLPQFVRAQVTAAKTKREAEQKVEDVRLQTAQSRLRVAQFNELNKDAGKGLATKDILINIERFSKLIQENLLALPEDPKDDTDEQKELRLVDEALRNNLSRLSQISTERLGKAKTTGPATTPAPTPTPNAAGEFDFRQFSTEQLEALREKEKGKK